MITREQLRDIVSEYEQLYGVVEKTLNSMHKRMMDLEDAITDIRYEQEENTNENEK